MIRLEALSEKRITQKHVVEMPIFILIYLGVKPNLALDSNPIKSTH